MVWKYIIYKLWSLFKRNYEYFILFITNNFLQVELNARWAFSILVYIRTNATSIHYCGHIMDKNDKKLHSKYSLQCGLIQRVARCILTSVEHWNCPLNTLVKLYLNPIVVAKPIFATAFFRDFHILTVINKKIQKTKF